MQANFVMMRGLRVLLVEDHGDMRAALSSYLVMRGCIVEEARNVKEGSKKLAEGEWDLLLADVFLPDGTGFELSGSPGFRRCYAVSMSAQDRFETEKKSAAAGFARHLQKPIDPDDIDKVTAEAYGRGEVSEDLKSSRTLYSIIFSSTIEIDEQKIIEIASAYCPGFSFFSGLGIWMGRKERTHLLMVASDNPASVSAMTNRLKKEFRQDSVIQITHPGASVRFV